MFNKLRTIIYHAADLAAAREWYTRATGQEPYFDQPFYVGFDINGFELGIDPDMTNVEKGNHTTAYWAVDDIDIALEKLVSLGATVIQNKLDVGGNMFTAIVGDPFGNNIGLIQGD